MTRLRVARRAEAATSTRQGGGAERGFIRPFRREDIPAVVTLRRHAFRLSERETPADLADYFDVTFFGNPWCDPSFPSWIYEDPKGAIGGFVGVLPRPLTWRGRSILAAVATQLMVAPGIRGAVGTKLAQAFLSGAQDLSLSDTANDAARRLWLTLGGVAPPARRLGWRRRLPARLRPTDHGPPAGTYTTTLEPSELLPCITEVLVSCRLAPTYDLRSLGWLLSLAGGKQGLGRLTGGVVRDAAGMPVGWLLYYIGNGKRRAEVLQLGSVPGARTLVLEHALWQAWSQGAREVRGRVEGPFRSALSVAQCEFTTAGPWVLLKARDPDLLADLEPERDDVFLSRLDGEWYLSF